MRTRHCLIAASWLTKVSACFMRSSHGAEEQIGKWSSGGRWLTQIRLTGTTLCQPIHLLRLHERTSSQIWMLPASWHRMQHPFSEWRSPDKAKKNFCAACDGLTTARVAATNAAYIIRHDWLMLAIRKTRGNPKTTVRIA